MFAIISKGCIFRGIVTNEGNDMNELDADLKIDCLLEKAYRGDKKATDLLIEPIGNSDECTELFVKLIALARVDMLEDHSSEYYSPSVEHVRNACRVEAYDKLTKALDKYYMSVLEDETLMDIWGLSL